MLWLTILLAAIISLAALGFVLWPIVRPGPPPVLVEDDRLTDLLARKDAVLASIKELEFDYHVGKISDEDFELFNERLRRQAIGLLQQIEKVAPESAGLDEQLEREIARLRKTKERLPLPESVQPEMDTAAIAAAPPAPRPRRVKATAETTENPETADASTLYCTNCGEAIDPAHKFCGHCGAPRPEPSRPRTAEIAGQSPGTS